MKSSGYELQFDVMKNPGTKAEFAIWDWTPSYKTFVHFTKWTKLALLIFRTTKNDLALKRSSKRRNEWIDRPTNRLMQLEAESTARASNSAAVRNDVEWKWPRKGAQMWGNEDKTIDDNFLTRLSMVLQRNAQPSFSFGLRLFPLPPYLNLVCLLFLFLFMEQWGTFRC